METTKVSEIQSMKTNEGHMENNEIQEDSNGKSVKFRGRHMRTNESQSKLYRNIWKK